VRLDAGGAGTLAATLRPPAPAGDLDVRVRAIVEDVRARGDAALVDQVRAFDCPGFRREQLAVSPEEIRRAVAAADPALRAAIAAAAAQVRAVAEAQRPGDVHIEGPVGQRVVIRAIPVDAAGLYVPGGRAAYPSSLIMGAVPARVAGVGRVAVTSPPGPDGHVHPAVLAAAGICGVDEVYAVGGAGAVAALAYGTETVAPVAVVAGPGNSWVQEAKRQAVGRVGIDGIAGPSELVVVADASADPEAVAADLLAQAEHGPDSPAVLASDDPEVLDAVAGALARQPAAVGSVTLVECATRALAIELAEAFAPEHLQLCVRDAARAAAGIRHAGCVFLGPSGATAFGDYVAGSNHILPTGGAARHSSAVGPATFTRRMSMVELPQEAVVALTPHLARLADAEGFPQHRRSAELRVGA
jgi:histidinol dehydrogenase